MPGSVFARLVAFDGAVHGWDLAISTGQAWALSAELGRSGERAVSQLASTAVAKVSRVPS